MDISPSSHYLIGLQKELNGHTLETYASFDLGPCRWEIFPVQGTAKTSNSCFLFVIFPSFFPTIEAQVRMAKSERGSMRTVNSSWRLAPHFG